MVARSVRGHAVVKFRIETHTRRAFREHYHAGDASGALDRYEIERALELNAEELKPRRSEIKGCIDMVLNECACCLADLSGHPSRDELEDPRDLRKYCIPCWKAYAMRRDEMR